MVAMMVDAFGVRLAAIAADMRGQIQAGRFFWLDVFAGDEPARTELLREMGARHPGRCGSTKPAGCTLAATSCAS